MNFCSTFLTATKIISRRSAYMLVSSTDKVASARWYCMFNNILYFSTSKSFSVPRTLQLLFPINILVKGNDYI